MKRTAMALGGATDGILSVITWCPLEEQCREKLECAPPIRSQDAMLTDIGPFKFLTKCCRYGLCLAFSGIKHL